MEAKNLLDFYCKKTIGNIKMLARILKTLVIEVKDFSEKEIINFIENVKIYNNLDRINETEEGKVLFDILFELKISGIHDDFIKVIINIEIQNNRNPGYKIENRGLFYVSRLINLQYNKEFDSHHYDDMKNVYSIWILPDATEENDGLIEAYEMRKVSIRGENDKKEEKYDKLKVFKIHTSLKHDINNKYAIHDELLTPVHVVLSTEYDTETKNRILEEYELENDTLNEEVDSMCNYSEIVEANGVAKGIEQGIELEKIESICSVMNNLKLSIYDAMKVLDIPESKFVFYEDLIKTRNN